MKTSEVITVFLTSEFVIKSYLDIQFGLRYGLLKRFLDKIGEMIFWTTRTRCVQKKNRVFTNNDFNVRCWHTGCFFALAEKYKEEAFWII